MNRTMSGLLISALLFYLNISAFGTEFLNTDEKTDFSSNPKEFLTFVKTISFYRTLGDEPAGIAVDQLHNRIYIANSASHSISIVNGATNHILGEIDISNSAREPISIAMDTDKAYIACLTPPSVLILDLSNNQPTKIINLGQGPAIVSDQQNRRIYVLSQESLIILDANNDTIINKINVPPDARDLAVNPNTGKVYIAGNGITVIHPDATIAQIPELPEDESFEDIAVNSVTNRVYATRYSSNQIYVIDGGRDKLLSTLKHTTGESPTDIAVDPRNNQIYISLEGHLSYWCGGYFIIDGKSNQPGEEVVLGDRFYRFIAVNPSTGFVYVQGPNGISVVKETEQVALLPGGYAGVYFDGVVDLAVNQITQKLYIVGNWGKPSFVINLKNEKVKELEVVPDSVHTEPMSIMVNPVTNKVYVANCTTGGGFDELADVVIIDGEKDEIDESLWEGGGIDLGRLYYPEILAVDTKANQIYVGKDSVEAVIDAATGDVKEFQGAIPPTAVKRRTTIQQIRSPITHRVYKVEPKIDALTVWDNEAKQKLGELKVGKSPLAIAFNPETRQIYVVDSRGNVTVLKEEVGSAKVKLVSVQMPDSAQIGAPFQMAVGAQVSDSDSPKGGITLSFSKPVEIKIASSSASARFYPQGSKLWNQQLKANIESKHPMVELWVEYWQKEMIHQLSLDVTPLEAGDLDVFIRSTATDAASGENVNDPKEGVLDQQGFPCEKRTISIKAQQTSSEGLTDWIKKLEDANESIRQETKKQLLDIIWQKNVRPLVEKKDKESGTSYASGFGEADILLSDIDGDGSKEIIASIGLFRYYGYVAVMDKTLSALQELDVYERPIVNIIDLLGEGKQALIIESGGGAGTGIGQRMIEIYQWTQGNFTKIWEGIIKKWDVATSIYSYSLRAKVQIVDLDQDGIREIVRIGEISEGKCKEQPEGEQETGRARVEIEMGEEISEPEIETGAGLRDLSKVMSGYQVVYKFKETFFWNKDFNYYIQYTARITEDTATMDGEPVSIASVCCQQTSEKF